MMPVSWARVCSETAPRRGGGCEAAIFLTGAGVQRDPEKQARNALYGGQATRRTRGERPAMFAFGTAFAPDQIGFFSRQSGRP